MTAIPTLPGSLPGLLRLGSPIRWLGARGVFIDELVPGDGHEWLVAHGASAGSVVHVGDNRWPDLDLSDRTGRTHAMWWLASKVGLPAIGTSGIPLAAAGLAFLADKGYPAEWRSWSLRTWSSSAVQFQPVPRCSDGGAKLLAVPALEGVSPKDERVLLDGSRWVDAEALRLICLHFAREGGLLEEL